GNNDEHPTTPLRRGFLMPKHGGTTNGCRHNKPPNPLGNRKTDASRRMGRRIRGGQLRHTRIRRSDGMPGRSRRLRRHTQPIPGAQMNTHHHDETTKVIHGDCIETMNQMEPASVDAIVTDPPYGLGFMGKKWDSLPPSREWAEACYRVLKSGGHIAAFGGTRTWHRLAVA